MKKADEKEKQIAQEARILAEEENYSEAVTLLADSEEEQSESDVFVETAVYKEYKERESGDDGIKISYSFNPDEVDVGLKEWQKQTIRRKNMIYSVLLGVIIALQVQTITVDPTYSPAYFFTVIAVALLTYLWYLPYRHRKTVVASIIAVETEFDCTIYPDAFFSGNDKTVEKIDFKNIDPKRKPRAVILPEIFILGKEKENNVFMIPKRCMSEEDVKKVTEYLKPFIKEG